MNDSDLRFDLIHEPWITVRHDDGQVGDASLLELFTSAHRILSLVGEVPTQVFAMTRLLLAILHRAVAGPRDLAHWRQLWEAEVFPVEDITAYLHKHKTKFDLFHPKTPFLQVADIATEKGEMSDLSKLIVDVPNGRPFFTTRIGAVLRVSYAEAARWVVHCQAFDSSGIKAGPTDDPRTKKGKGYPIGVAWSGSIGGVLVGGATLKETLLLNMVPHDMAGSVSDLPSWERTDHAPGEGDDREPSGPADLFTWRSRRVRLHADNGVVSKVLICNGDRRTPQNMHIHEVHTAWRRSQAQEKKLRSPTPVYMPLEHNPDRTIWRGLQAMLPEAKPESGRERRAPRVLDWIAQLTHRRVLPHDRAVSLRTIGMVYGAQSSTTSEIIDDALSMRAILFAQDASSLLRVVKESVIAAESAASAVGRLGANLAVAAGSREPDGARSRAAQSAYAAFDPLFRQWLATLGPGCDPDVAATEWQTTARAAAFTIADALLNAAPLATWVGRLDRSDKLMTSAHARKWFGKALREALPRAYRTEVPA